MTKHLKPVDGEGFVVNDTYRVAGSFDRIWELPDGRRVIGDLKTGSLRMLEHAIQLHCYASAERYDVKTGQRSPLDVDQDLGIVVWVPRDRQMGDARLVGVDLSAGRELALLAQSVRASRSRKVEVGLSIEGEEANRQ